MSQPRTGYHRLAEFMGGDSNLAIFRRFDDLNLLCLLSVQAEIVALRHQFYLRCDLNDQKGSPDERLFSTSFEKSRDGPSHQYNELKVLQEKLATYNRMLVDYSKVNQMGPPRKGQLKLLQAWLLDPNAKGGGNFLSDVELTTWLESFKPDHYISLNPNLAEDDVFTNTMMNFVIPKLHECFGEKGGYVSYKDSTIVKFSNILVTILASIIPPITILLLNALHTTIERIIVTIAFTAVFAIVLACLTSAKRVEILAATATFAAVEVVFIGSAISSSEVSQLSGNLTVIGNLTDSAVVNAILSLGN